MTKLNQLFLEMLHYYRGDAKRIQHFTKVHSYARLIGELEGLAGQELLTLEAAAYVHDIGIRPAEEKYGSCGGRLQEQEGVVPAEEMLRGRLLYVAEKTRDARRREQQKNTESAVKRCSL